MLDGNRSRLYSFRFSQLKSDGLSYKQTKQVLRRASKNVHIKFIYYIAYALCSSVFPVKGGESVELILLIVSYYVELLLSK